MIAVYRHVPLDRLAMSRIEVADWVELLNAELPPGYAPAVITADGALALDARLAERLNL